MTVDNSFILLIEMATLDSVVFERIVFDNYSFFYYYWLLFQNNRVLCI